MGCRQNFSTSLSRSRSFHRKKPHGMRGRTLYRIWESILYKMPCTECIGWSDGLGIAKSCTECNVVCEAMEGDDGHASLSLMCMCVCVCVCVYVCLFLHAMCVSLSVYIQTLVLSLSLSIHKSPIKFEKSPTQYEKSPTQYAKRPIHDDLRR